MANILGIFTAIILAVSAFVAIKNKGRLESEIESRINKEAVLVQTKSELLAAQETLNAMPVERAEIEAQVVAQAAEEAKLKESIETLKAEIEAKTAEIAKNKAEQDAAPDAAPDDGFGGDTGRKLTLDEIVALVPKMKQNSAALEELTQDLAAKEASLANLTAKNTASQAEADKRKADLDALSKGESISSLRTTIRSIYPTWGFVTLNDGNNAGVTASSSLDVVRDGETIARLLVTAVETRSASASIIPDSMADGVTLMVGDRVVPSTKSKIAPAN